MKATRCTIEGCDSGPGQITRGYCLLHYYRFYTYGDPHRKTKRAADRAGGPDRYGTMHRRITKERGPAKDYTCEHCGKPARDWAYDGEDPDERVDAVDGRHVFSVKIEHYHPLCRSCHRLLDWDRFYAATHITVGWRAALTKCKYGHPFDETNTAHLRDTKGRPGRRCLTCHAAREKLRTQTTVEEQQARKAAGLPVIDLAGYFARKAESA